jgi:hypothetical protein
LEGEAWNMEYQRRSSVARGIGAWLCVLGGALCGLGYFAPWITYYGGGGDTPDLTLNGWQAALGNGSVLYNPSGGLAEPACIVSAALSLAPLAMSACAVLAVGTRFLLGTSLAAFSFARRPFWTAAAMGTLGLMFMTYTLDPFGLNPESFWLLLHAPAPSVGPGFVMTGAGWLAVCAGGLLLAQRLTPRPTHQTEA